MNELVVTIKTTNLGDFVGFLKENGIKTIFRGPTSAGVTVTYTAWSPKQQAYLKCDFIVPEVRDLQRYAAEFSKWGGSYPHWSEQHGVLYTRPTTRRDFVACLKMMGVSPELVKEYRSVSVKKITEMIERGTSDASDAVEEVVRRENDTKMSKMLQCDWHDGAVKQVTIVLAMAGAGIQYTVAIEDWKEVLDGILDEHEKAQFNSIPELRIIEGEISVQTVK